MSNYLNKRKPESPLQEAPAFHRPFYTTATHESMHQTAISTFPPSPLVFRPVSPSPGAQEPHHHDISIEPRPLHRQHPPRRLHLHPSDKQQRVAHLNLSQLQDFPFTSSPSLPRAMEVNGGLSAAATSSLSSPSGTSTPASPSFSRPSTPTNSLFFSGSDSRKMSLDDVRKMSLDEGTVTTPSPCQTPTSSSPLLNTGATGFPFPYVRPSTSSSRSRLHRVAASNLDPLTSPTSSSSSSSGSAAPYSTSSPRQRKMSEDAAMMSDGSSSSDGGMFISIRSRKHSITSPNPRSPTLRNGGGPERTRRGSLLVIWYFVFCFFFGRRKTDALV